MEQLTKNQAVATSQEAVQNQNEPQLRDENAHNDKSVHGVLKDRKSGSAGMPRPISYAVFCLKKKKKGITNLFWLVEEVVGAGPSGASARYHCQPFIPNLYT